MDGRTDGQTDEYMGGLTDRTDQKYLQTEQQMGGPPPGPPETSLDRQDPEDSQDQSRDN